MAMLHFFLILAHCVCSFWRTWDSERQFSQIKYLQCGASKIGSLTLKSFLISRKIDVVVFFIFVILQYSIHTSSSSSSYRYVSCKFDISIIIPVGFFWRGENMQSNHCCHKTPTILVNQIYKKFDFVIRNIARMLFLTTIPLCKQKIACYRKKEGNNLCEYHSSQF